MTSHLMKGKADPLSALEELGGVMRLIGDSLERTGDYPDTLFCADGDQGRREIADEAGDLIEQILSALRKNDKADKPGFYGWHDCLQTRLLQMGRIAAFIAGFSRHRRHIDPHCDSDAGIAALMDVVNAQLTSLADCPRLVSEAEAHWKNNSVAEFETHKKEAS